MAEAAEVAATAAAVTDVISSERASAAQFKLLKILDTRRQGDQSIGFRTPPCVASVGILPTSAGFVVVIDAYADVTCPPTIPRVVDGVPVLLRRVPRREPVHQISPPPRRAKFPLWLATLIPGIPPF